MENLAFKNALHKFEIKDLHADDEFVHIEGLASTFGNLDLDRDIIAKGAFANSLATRMPKLLNQHRQDQPIGVIDQAFEAEEGLRIKARMPKDNSMVKDLFPLLRMGAISSFSIGFNILEADTSSDGVRTIKEIDLQEVSIVTFPANEEAVITGVKKLDENKENKETKDIDDKIVDAIKAESISTKREFEQMLKDTGLFTKKAMITLASRFKEFDVRGDLDTSKKAQRDSVGEGNTKLLKEAMDKLKKSLTKEV